MLVGRLCWRRVMSGALMRRAEKTEVAPWCYTLLAVGEAGSSQLCLPCDSCSLPVGQTSRNSYCFIFTQTEQQISFFI